MREILFRAKSINADSPNDASRNWWIEGSLVHQTEHYGVPVDVYHIVKPGTFHADYYDSDEVWPKTIGQFTGLFDRHGKKIFEGDIVLYQHGLNGCRKRYYEVSYDPECGCWEPFGDSDHAFRSIEVEVVGNIHDNPNLGKK